MEERDISQVQSIRTFTMESTKPYKQKAKSTSNRLKLNSAINQLESSLLLPRRSERRNERRNETART